MKENEGKWMKMNENEGKWRMNEGKWMKMKDEWTFMKVGRIMNVHERSWAFPKNSHEWPR